MKVREIINSRKIQKNGVIHLVYDEGEQDKSVRASQKEKLNECLECEVLEAHFYGGNAIIEV